MSDSGIEKTVCRLCGQRRRLNEWCGSDACADRVAAEKEALNRALFGDEQKGDHQ